MYQYFCYTVTLSAVAAYSIKRDNDDKIDATTFFYFKVEALAKLLILKILR